MTDTYYCPHYGSTDVYWDAWLNANDHSDYLYFSNAWCRDCDKTMSILDKKDE